jgi:hypothetical protein
MKIRGFLAILVMTMAIVYFVLFLRPGKHGGGVIKTEVEKFGRTRMELTKVNMGQLEKAIEYYVAAEGSAPADLKELFTSRLVGGDASDAWGRPIRYEKLSDSDFRLTSAGPDGRFGTKDDIVVQR